MNRIEVKLQGETRDIEFESPVKMLDYPIGGFYLSRNFWIGIALGVFISVCAIFLKIQLHDKAGGRKIGIEGAIQLRAHGLSWCNTENDWVRDATKPDFITYPSP